MIEKREGQQRYEADCFELPLLLAEIDERFMPLGHLWVTGRLLSLLEDRLRAHGSEHVNLVLRQESTTNDRKHKFLFSSVV